MCSFSSPLSHAEGRMRSSLELSKHPHHQTLFLQACVHAGTPQVAGLGTSREVELPLSNYKSTIFFYVQRLLQLSCSGTVKTDKLRRIWEPTYT